MKTLRRMPSLLPLLTFGFGSLTAFCQPMASWPMFRGPNASGLAPNGTRALTNFGPGTNQAWVLDAPSGYSSPILWGDNLFLTGYSPSPVKLELLCIDRTLGTERWRREIPGVTSLEQLDPGLTPNTHASPTPATDGSVVVAYFGAYGLIAHDMTGRALWNRALPRVAAHNGVGSSPILVEGRVILDLHLCTNGFVLALDAKTGEEIWRAPKQHSTRGWATPVVWQEEGDWMVGLLTPGRFAAHHLKDGSTPWWCGGVSSETSSTPVVGGGRVYFHCNLESGDDSVFVPVPSFDELVTRYDANKDGRLSTAEIPDDVLAVDRKFAGKGVAVGSIPLRLWIEWDHGGPVDFDQNRWATYMVEYDKYRNDVSTTQPRTVALRIGGRGDVTEKNMVWEERKGVPDVASPLLYGDRLYLIRNGGILTCRDASSGRLVFQERIGAPGGYYSSPVAAGGHIYTASDRGRVTVLAQGDALRILAQNDLGEAIFSTPALADHWIYVRTRTKLFGFTDGIGK